MVIFHTYRFDVRDCSFHEQFFPVLILEYTAHRIWYWSDSNTYEIHWYLM